MASSECLRKLTLLSCMALLSAAPGLTEAAKYKAPAMDVLQLPQFCWSQYMDNVKGPQYEIPSATCGWGMNHYCPALAELRSSQRTHNRAEKIGKLKVVRHEIEYTITAMKDFPSCPIRQHVENTRLQVNGMLNAYGVRP